MERLVDRIVPDDAPGPSHSQHSRRSPSASPGSAPPIPGRRASSIDMIEASATSEGPIAALLAMRHESVHRCGPSESEPIPTPALTSAEPSTPSLPALATPQGTASRPVTRAGAGQVHPPISKHFWVCNTLRSIIPSRAAIEAILAASPAAQYVVHICYSDAERYECKVEPVSSLATIPPISAHPLLLAKRALQVLICIQQLPPSFDWESLGNNETMPEIMGRLSNTSTLVTSNDELIGYVEGLECLLLQAHYQANGGNLRRAWTTVRRALSLAQMMRIDKGPSIAFRSCETTFSTQQEYKPSSHVLWSKVISWDRYLSLLLGFQPGNQNEAFPSVVPDRDTPVERLGKAHAVLSARISARNFHDSKDSAVNYALTQEIDLALESAASVLPQDWWEEPDFPKYPEETQQLHVWENTARCLTQIHHYTLVILLHAGYMLRDANSPRYDYSKTTCLMATRALLTRFALFRARITSAHSCRRIDYAAMLASMTLCLAYLSRRRTEAWNLGRARDDAELVASVRRRFEAVSRINGDRLSREAVGILERLAGIIEDAVLGLEGMETGRGFASSMASRDLHLDVPYLGTVTIRIPGTSVTAPEWHVHGHGHRRHPSSATGSLERMALSSSASASVVASSISTDMPQELGTLQFVPRTEQGPLAFEEPDFMASGEDWAFQGVDSTYWSLFEGIL